MKLFMSVDLEGFAGVSFWSEIDKKNPASLDVMKTVTQQVSFLCEKLKERYKDLETITVCDSHARGNNLVYEDLPEYVELIKGFPRRYYMMEGLEKGYSGVVFAGYHVSAGSIGNMDHTYSSSVIHDIKLNGIRVSELAINSYFAGEYSVPVLMALGGDLFIQEASNFCGQIGLCTVKEEYGRYSGKSYSMKTVKDKISQCVAGLHTADEYPVHRLGGPIEMSIEFNDTAAAEIASLVPGSKRLSGRRVDYTCDHMKEIYEVLMLVVMAAGRAADIY